MNGQPVGHLRVEERATGPRVWVAAYVDSAKVKRRRVLGPAWVKPSTRRSSRGATVWRAADGSCPAGHLTPKAAAAVLEDILEVERAKAATPSWARNKTMGEATAAFLGHTATVGGRRGAIAPSTLRGYESVVKVLAAAFPPDLLLREITPRQLEEYQERCLTLPPAGGQLPGRATVRHRMVVLRMIFARAVALGWLGESPAAGVAIIPQPEADSDFNVLEPGQVEAVARAIAAVPDEQLPRYRAASGVETSDIDARALEVMTERRAVMADLVRIAAYTGLRFGELRALRWRDVDFAGATLHVRRNAPVSAPAGSKLKAPKSRHARSVPVIDAAAAALDRVSRHLVRHGLPTGPEALVFPTREGGLLDDKRVRDEFYRGLVDAGLGYVREKDNPMTFHDLRHTFGTIAVRVFPLTDVQAYMGHQSITTTMRYVHHVPRTDAAAKLSEAFAVDLGGEPVTGYEARGPARS